MSNQTKLVIKQILDYIREHNLQPGDPMPGELVLIEHLGVSRSTLREAIRELRTLHIIEVRHGFGSFVGQASLSFLSEALVFRTQAPGRNLASGLRELIEVRSMLEVGLAEKVIGHLTPDQLERLYACTERMTENQENSAADREFHTILYEQVDNEIAKQLIATFWDAFDQINLVSDHSSVVSAPKDLHQGIIRAYQSGDLAQAQAAMAEHFLFIKQRLSEQLS